MGTRNDNLREIGVQLQQPPAPKRKPPMGIALEDDPDPKGGLVHSLKIIGAVFLALAALALIAGFVVLFKGGLTEGSLRYVALGFFTSASSGIIVGIFLLWMAEVLYELRRIRGR